MSIMLSPASFLGKILLGYYFVGNSASPKPELVQNYFSEKRRVLNFVSPCLRSETKLA